MREGCPTAPCMWHLLGWRSVCCVVLDAIRNKQAGLILLALGLCPPAPATSQVV